MASRGKWDRTNHKKNGEIMVALGEIIGIYMEIMIGHTYLCVRVSEDGVHITHIAIL
jgi:hypothetical protein